MTPVRSASSIHGRSHLRCGLALAAVPEAHEAEQADARARAASRRSRLALIRARLALLLGRHLGVVLPDDAPCLFRQRVPVAQQAPAALPRADLNQRDVELVADLVGIVLHIAKGLQPALRRALAVLARLRVDPREDELLLARLALIKITH